MRGYKDIKVEKEKLLIGELPKLQIEVVQLQTIGKVYAFLEYAYVSILSVKIP